MTTKRTNPGFPKDIYVHFEEDGRDGDLFLVANEDIKSVAEVGEPRRVGIYRFVRTATVKTEVKCS